MDKHTLTLGTTWVNSLGDVYTLVNVNEHFATFERRYTDPGEPGFCEPYGVVERDPIPLQWALDGTKYKPWEAS